jgi:glycosyl transferase, family 25
MNGAMFLCINLQRSPQRREAMEAEARRAGIDLTFVQAVDGKELSLEMAPGYDRKARLQHAPHLKSNEVACVLSHKAALEMFLSSGAPAAAVLEDDAVLSDQFVPFVEAVVKSPLAWSAVNLENRNGKPLYPAVVRFGFGVGLHASAWLSKGTAGWLYSRTGAERIVRSLSRFRHAYDTHMGFFWRHGITPLCAHPPVVSSREDSPSTISALGEPRLFSEKQLSLQQFLRARRERIEHEIRKEIGARAALVRLKLALARAGYTGNSEEQPSPSYRSKSPV